MEIGYVWLIGAIFLNVIAQFLLKFGARVFSSTSETGDIMSKVASLATNPLFIAAMISYGLSFVIYFVSLSKIDLSKAYPIVGVSVMVLVFVGSVLFLHENLNWAKVLGVILCVVGIILIYIKG